MDNIVIRRGWKNDAPLKVDNLCGSAFTGETKAHTFRIYAEGGTQMSGSVTGKLLAANGVTVPLTGSIDSGEVVLTLTSDCYRAPGQFILTIYTTSGTTTVCVYCGIGSVMIVDSETVAYPSAAIPDIVTLIEQVQAVIATIPSDYSDLSAHFPATGRFVVGTDSTVSSNNSASIGLGNTASAPSAQALGSHTIANHAGQHTFGAYNAPDPSENGAAYRGNYIEIVGNGLSDNARSNARTLDWSGNEVLAGTITASGVNLNTAVSALQAAVNIATVAETKTYLNIT